MTDLIDDFVFITDPIANRIFTDIANQLDRNIIQGDIWRPISLSELGLKSLGVYWEDEE